MNCILFVLLMICQRATLGLKSNFILFSRWASMNVHLDWVTLLHQMRPNDPSKTKLVYVPTASMAYSKESTRKRGEQRRRNRYDAKQRVAALQEAYELDAVMLNLDEPELNKKETKRMLAENAAVIFVDGGNTFYLKQHMESSGFKDMIKEPLENGLVYMGASAGAICAGNSIGTAYWKGWDSVGSAEEWVGWEEWTSQREKGLGIIDKDFFPHYQEDIHSTLVKEKLKNYPYEVKICTDEMAVVQSYKDNILRTFDFFADGSMGSLQMQQL